MGLSKPGIKPSFKIRANDADITDTIASRLLSLHYSDSAGLSSDVLEFTIADGLPDERVEMPKTGAELSLYLGYDGTVNRMGKFVVDEVEREGWPDTITVRAKAATFEQSKGGEKQLQTQKNRTWEKTKFGDMVSKVAKEHGLTGTVSKSLQSIQVSKTHQIDESDLHFLIRIGRRYDAVIKVAGGQLMAVKKSEGKTMSGLSLTLSVEPGDVSSYHLVLAKREEAGTVRAYWHETKKAKRHAVTVGTGQPEINLKGQYTDQASAAEAAKAELARRGRQKSKLTLTMPGRPELVAEAHLSVSGFVGGVNGTWNIAKVEHSLNASGWVSSIECEQAAGYTGTPDVNDTTEGADDPHETA